MKKSSSKYGLDSNLRDKVNKEQLEDLYCNQYLSLTKIGKELGIYYTSVSKLIDYYGLKRDPSKCKSLAISQSRQKFYTEVKNKVTRESLYKYYIEEDHNYYETIEYFAITEWQFDKLLKDYKIKKDRSKSYQKGLSTKIQKAGGEKAYKQKIKRKQENTILQKYGSKENYYRIRQKRIEQVNQEKYGAKYKATADLMDNHSELYRRVWGSREESETYLKSFKDKPSVSFLAEELNCTENCVHLWIEKYQLVSYVKNIKTKYEEEIVSFLKSLKIQNIKLNDRKILKGLELDIYLPDFKLAIEFNGNYHHSSLCKDKHYHFNKSFECEKQNIRLIHIYQYQWDDPIKQEILKSIIQNALGKNLNIIYARKCELRELSKKDVKDFSIKNSNHGHRNASVYLGLFYKGDLVQLMSFGKAFFARDPSIDYECIRAITKINTTVVGGMNKLFKHFIKKYNPNKVLYYVDYNTHIGTSMDKLGFKFISYSKGGLINIANCKEVLLKYGFVFNRKPQANKEIQQYIKEGKVLSIYDAGVKKYIWNRDS